MTAAVPVWFGPVDRPLFGWRHEPVGGWRGATVVVCPPIGYEAIAAYRTMRTLATSLADVGFRVLRFDYDGTGDSVGAFDDPDRLSAWRGSVRHAIAEARGSAPDDGDVVVVGMRLGAALAATALSDAEVDSDREPVAALVLWDPVLAGKRYLREVSLLHRAAFEGDDGTRPDGSVEAVGSVFSAETVEALRALDVANVRGRLADDVLLLHRPDRPPSDAVRASLRAASSRLTELEAHGQEQLVDVRVPDTVIPVATIAALGTWLTERWPTLGPAEATARSSLANATTESAETTAVVATTDDGHPVRERPLRLGPRGLFAMATAADHAHGPWVVCLNNGAGYHIGPQRLWVDLARQWAAGGARVVRVDLTGFGESPDRSTPAPDPLYPPDAVAEVREALEALQPQTPDDAVLVGLCSAAYIALDTAAVVGARAVLAANPYLAYRPPTADDAAAPGVTSPNGALPRRRSPVARLQALPVHDWLEAHLPPLAWFALDRLGLHASPLRSVERTLARGADVLLVYIDDDALAPVRRRGRWILRRLGREGGDAPRFTLLIEGGDDHSLILRRSRDHVARVFSSRVAEAVASRH